MELLGQLGIDPLLLLAQILNFGLLLWILTKFLYRPIIKRIESDEKLLKNAETAKASMDKKGTEFQASLKKEKLATIAESKKMIKDAEAMREDIKRAALLRAQDDADGLLKQAREQMRDEEGSFRETLEKAVREEYLQKLIPVLKNEFTPSVLDALDEAYFAVLLKKISVVPIGDAGAVRSVRLECARTQRGDQLARLQAALTKKLGILPKVTQKNNESLLCGFRLEIAGTEVNCSLSSDLQYAAEKR